MSKIKFNPPLEHIPSFKEYTISTPELLPLIRALGCRLPLGALDGQYWYTNLDGWLTVLVDMLFKSNLYREDRFDCDSYALKAMSLCAERYGLNSLALVIGNIPQGRHAFNMLYTGSEFLLWEPNAGFEYGVHPFPIGEFGYVPDEVLL